MRVDMWVVKKAVKTVEMKADRTDARWAVLKAESRAASLAGLLVVLKASKKAVQKVARTDAYSVDK